MLLLAPPGYHVMNTTHHIRSSPMSEHTYKMIELVGSSHVGIEEAVKNAVAKAAIDEKTCAGSRCWKPGGTSRTARSPTGRCG